MEHAFNYARRHRRDMDKIESVPVIVKDKAAALEFYTKTLGFEKKTDVTNYGYRWLTVGPKGQDLQLELWQVGSADSSGLPNDWKPGSAPPMVLLVDDCRKLFADLKSRGVEVKRELQEYPGGVSATFSDPDGNLFTLRGIARKEP